MTYYSADDIKKAKEIDLLSYLQKNNPENLKYIGRDTFETVNHDSLKISNGLWFWFSRGIGGKGALEYLIQVEGKSFIEAMGILSGTSNYKVQNNVIKYKDRPMELKMPQKNDDENIGKRYLINRGIDEAIIQECIDKDLIYQEVRTNNVVFVGYDRDNKPRYVSARGTKNTKYFNEARGSNKAFSFKLLSENNSNEVHIFESAIDVLSYATLLKMQGKKWYEYNLLSLAGVYKIAKNIEESKIPLALNSFLDDNGKINKIALHLDNDEAGKLSSKAIISKLKDKYEIVDSPPKYGKDINDFLMYKIQKNRKLNKER